MRRNTLMALAVLALVLVAMAGKSLLVSVPAVRPHNVAGQFDANRAKARLARVLADERPHPVDSGADDQVRARLITELRGLGLKPVVRDQSTCNEFAKARLVACARIRNVIAILGPPTGKALLLNAHYDSVPVGPGAGDDGVGVATLLEVARNLSTRPLPRPIILLFNEGEELGLVGARAFLADPLSRNVDSMLNFEARGVTGPVAMFETSQPNGAAMAAFASSVARPSASSLTTDVYRLLPNDTDVTTFSERGWLTLNFAMTGNETRYHSPGDNLAALDLRSLQHMGDQALALANELAAGVPQPRSQQIFVDLLGRTFVHMPLAVGLTVFLLLLGSFAFLTFKRRAYGRPLATVVLAFGCASLFGWLTSLLLGAVRAGTYWRARPEFAFVAIYAAALLAIVLLSSSLGRKAQTGELRIAFWTLFLALGGALALAAPGAIIYFIGPPTLVLAGIAASRWNRSAELAGALLALFLLYLTWGELLALLEELFSPGPLWIVGPVATLLMMAAVVEAHGWIRAAHRRTLLWGAALLTAGATAAAVAAPAYSADRQQMFTVEHVTSFPSGASQWSLLTDGATLPPDYDRFGDWKLGTLSFSERKRWLASAPSVSGLRAPSIEIVELLKQGSSRTMRLRLRTNGAERLAIIAPPEARIRSAGVPTSIRPLTDPDSAGEFNIVCSGRSCDGAELQISQNTATSVPWTLVGVRNGLPATAQPLLGVRPTFARPQYAPDETITVARVKL